MIPVATAAEMRELDARTIREVGLPGAVLMETAGRGVAAVVAGLRPRRVFVLCGAGNNGGDGFVIARVLRAGGVDAAVYLAAPRERIGGDAALYLAAYERTGGVVHDAFAVRGRPERGAGEGPDVIVDALFGTGLDRPITGPLADLITSLNAAAAIRVAVDIPSGLSADTGHPLGVAIRADHTVTMAVPKVGIVGAPGFASCGTLHIVEIGIPRALAEAGTRASLSEAADARAWLPVRGVLDHKNRRGHVLVIAGSPGKRGAGALASLAALRGGAGLATLAGPAGPDLRAADAVMTAALFGPDLAAVLAGKQAVVIGPGMPDDDTGRAWLDAVLAQELPAVVDATGLAHLAGRLDAVAAAGAPLVLTPHPGEAARLLDSTTAAVEADRMAAVRTLAARTRAVVVLKGARTLICDPATEHVTINPTGSPALGTAGTGDVLAGLIGALLAQGLAPLTAARLGVYLHGAAGEALHSRWGTGATAGDLPDAIAASVLTLRE